MDDQRRTGFRYSDLHVGMAFRSPGRTITDADLVGFAGLTGDHSELHTSDVYAKNSQFGRRVAHGMLGLAYAHGLMWARTGELRETAVAFLGISDWRFIEPIFVGDTIFVNYQISELRDSTFYAKLMFDAQEVDARPSDAIALAVRFGSPIFVAEKVMDEAGFLPDAEEPEGGEAASPAKGKEGKPNKLETLRAALKEAVEREDYEKAAQLRDEIRNIEQRH